MQAQALVLRTTAYRDADLVVDLLTAEAGRVAVLARGARRSRKRFPGALEIGTRLDVRIDVRGRGMRSLTSCDVRGALNVVRTDLDRINQMSYVIEIARFASREGEADPRLFGLVVDYIAALETAPPSSEALALWELATLSHLGYGLRFGNCPLTGRPPDGLSLQAGGAVLCAAARDAEALTPEAVALLARLSGGDARVRFAPEQSAAIRRAFAGLWARIGGRPLRTAPYLVLPPAQVR